MICRFAWIELRQQVRGRIFWIVFAVSVLMVGGAMAIDELRVGLADDGARTGAAAIVRTHLVWSLFFLFTAAALVGEAVLRDNISGFAQLVRATPVNRAGYALGRFTGALAAVLLCFLSVPAALGAGGVVLGLGSGSAEAYLFGYLGLALPNLLLASALFFALAAATRSISGCLLGAAGVLTLYGLAGNGGSAGAALIEPFGFAAVNNATLSWSLAQRDANSPALAGALLANRVIWLGVAAILTGLGTWLAARGERRTGERHLLRKETDTRAARVAGQDRLPGLPTARSGWKTVLVQLAARTRFEAGRVVLTPVFAALLAMGLANAVAAASRVAGTPSTITALAGSFQLVPVVVALFFAGELFWAECEHKVAPIISATPVNKTVLILPKLLALILVMLLLALASGGAGAATEWARNGSPSLGRYMIWYVIPQSYDWLLLGVLALFFQSLAPSKLAGWGYMVFYLIGSLALNKLGWQDPLYRYGGYPGAPLPPALSGAHGVLWYRLGWGMVAVLLAVLTCRFGPPRVALAGVRRPPRQPARSRQPGERGERRYDRRRAHRLHQKS